MKKWTGPVGHCDFCKTPLTSEFVDGKTTYGPWAKMCAVCYPTKGIGLGTGRGQKYKRFGTNNNIEWIKVEG